MRRALELLSQAGFAPALPFPAAVAQVRARCGLDLSGTRARCGFSRGHLLDVVVYVPGGLGGEPEQAAAEELVRLVIGEERFERWVGTVSATPTVRGGAITVLTVLNDNPEERAAFPLAALPDAITAAIAGLKLGLPAEPLPLHSQTEDWVLFELCPELADDYAAQDDLLIASTRLPEQKKSYLRGEPFFSGRFSKAGELFVYLKYESSVAAGAARLAERTAIEAQLTRTLRPGQGALVGVGLGIRYCYLDLALSDPDCARGALLPALRPAIASQRAWLLFCDSELDREWIPVHSEAPKPFWG